MKQTARIISTYSADVMGVCSALFELGGMTIMHDASGCNSTYTTHDEPRWYDMDSMVYISGISEMEAIMGDDEKLISDIVDAATKEELRAIAGDEKEIEGRFSKPLDFGTAGLRGIMCAGLFGMNVYTVRYATQGLADLIKSSTSVYILAIIKKFNTHFIGQNKI